ncbi:kinase-like domain-containing protein [Aspergillus tetrazonus]
MASGNWTSHIGPFEVLEWPTEAHTMGIDQKARHQITQERAYIKREWYRLLAHEALTLQAAAGGLGIPALHWLQKIGGKDVVLLEPYGPTLEEAFHQSGRYFGMQFLLGFGHQILSCMEFLHSRGIVHGNLSPWSFALGLGWQNQQLLLVDLNTDNHGKTTLDDLNAVYHIIGYLYSGAESWADYRLGDLPPFLSTFGRMLSRSKPTSVDYQSLQDVFLDAHHGLAVNLAIALDFEGPRAIKDGLSFDSLSIALPKVGELVDCRSASAAAVLECFEDIMDIYLILVIRDRPSPLKQPKGDNLRLALYAQAYRFITVLFDIKQSYREFWVGYLLYLARACKDLEADCGKAAWVQTISYWQGVVNKFNAEVESVTRSR